MQNFLIKSKNVITFLVEFSNTCTKRQREHRIYQGKHQSNKQTVTRPSYPVLSFLPHFPLNRTRRTLGAPPAESSRPRTSRPTIRPAEQQLFTS